MRKSNLIKVPAWLVIMLLTVSCYSRENRATEETATEPTRTEETNKSTAKNARENAPKPVKETAVKIRKVNFFLEASGGMAGFMPRSKTMRI